MSDRPHLTHSSWPPFHLTFHPLTSPHPHDYHWPKHRPSPDPSPVCYQLSGTNQPWYSSLAISKVCSRLSMLSGPRGIGRDPPYLWCHQIKRWRRFDSITQRIGDLSACMIFQYSKWWFCSASVCFTQNHVTANEAEWTAIHPSSSSII